MQHGHISYRTSKPEKFMINRAIEQDRAEALKEAYMQTQLLQPSENMDYTLSCLLKYMNEHLFDSTTNVTSAVRQCKMGDHNLSSAFCRATGYTLRTYVEHQRIALACILCQETHLRFDAIAALVGYNHVSTFTDAFRRKMGILPSHFYRNLQKNEGTEKSEEKNEEKNVMTIHIFTLFSIFISVKTAEVTMNKLLKVLSFMTLFAIISTVQPEEAVGAVPSDKEFQIIPTTHDCPSGYEAWCVYKKDATDCVGASGGSCYSGGA